MKRQKALDCISKAYFNSIPQGWSGVLTLRAPKGMRILASTVRTRYPNASIQISPFGYVHKRTRTARPRLKRFIRFFCFYSHICARFRIYTTRVPDQELSARPTSSFLCALYRCILLSHDMAFLFPIEKSRPRRTGL
jgi:hypothetical protein